jgi:membrane-associated HD superfamily phosphohydrolase
MGILKAKLDVAREKMKYDADAADLEANAAFAEAGADFLKANKDKFGLQDSITKLETQIKQNETWAKLMATKKSDAIAKLSAEKSREHEKELDRKQQSIIQSYLEQGRQQRAAESLESRERQAASDRQTRSLIAQLGQQGVQPIGMADGQLMVMDKAGNISSRQLPPGFTPSGKLAPSAKGSGSGGAVQFRYNSAMVNAGNQLAIEVANAADLPALAAPPVAAEVLTDPSKGLTEAGKRFFSQKITAPESRAMQQVFAGMQRAMTTIEASGRPAGATEAAIKEFGKTLPRAGDNKINTYLFLAQTRQVMEILEKDLKAAGASDEQIKQAIEARKAVEDVVSWTVKDVNRILSKDGSRLVDNRTRNLMQNSQTLNEFNSGLRRKSSEGTPSSVPRGTGTPEDPIKLD